MKYKTAFCVGVILLMAVMPFLPVRGESEVYGNTVRLHILANSDSTADQTLKLLVRDALVKKAEDLTSGCTDIESAKTALSENLGEFELIAENVLAENGCLDGVSVSLGKEYYPEREYGQLRLPSGTYNSLTVNIGESQGQNWWCVLFPPLCVDSAEAKEELAETGFTPSQIRLLTDSDTPKYVIRFRILEWISDISAFFSGK